MSSGEEIILRIDREEYSVLRFDYEFNRRIDVLGRPVSMVLGGEIHVVIESTDSTDILEQMALKMIPPVNGSIKVYSVMDLQCVKHIEFETGYITRYYERMTAEGKEPMMIELSISATRLDVNRKIFLDRRCPQTKGVYWELYKHPQPVKRRPTPREEQREEYKECTVWFRRSAQEEYDGSFGFDWLRLGDTEEECCGWYWDAMLHEEQYDLLTHKEYRFFTQRWKEKYDDYRATAQYTIPWVTLMEGKTARFRLKMEINKPSGPLDIKLTGAKEALSVNLTTLDGDIAGEYYYHTELEVTCKSQFSVETAIEVRAGHDLVGKMIFVPNDKVYDVDIDIVTVETVENGKRLPAVPPSENELKELTTLLQQMYVVPHFKHYRLDLTAMPEMKVSEDGKSFQTGYPVGTEGQVATSDFEIKEKGKSIFELLWKVNPDNRINTQSAVGKRDFETIPAYCKFVFERQHPSATGTYKLFFIHESADNGGIADQNAKAACVFKENYNSGTSSTLHELLHCFGLHHPFSKNSKYVFRKYSTDNVMDYNEDIGKSLWYWQIKEVWNHLKKQ